MGRPVVSVGVKQAGSAPVARKALIGRHRFWLFGYLLGAMALTGCENIGESRVESELARIRGEKGFAVISSTSSRAVFAVRGQRVTVEPPEGYCLDEGSIDVSRLAAFALVADCLDVQVAALETGSGAGMAREIALPHSFPGILTTSISGEPAFDQSQQSLDEFEAFIGTEQGRKLLGRGNGTVPGMVIATRKVGGALYVLVERQQTTGDEFLAPRFWRAFIDINDRLVLVTVSSFTDRPIGEDSMIGFLAHQIARLRSANGLPADGEEDAIARQMAVTLDLASGTDTLIVGRADAAAKASDATDPARAPRPPARRLANAQGAARGGQLPPTPPSAPRRLASAQVGNVAPSSAPVAPRRPG
jgi:hypothetical protein